MNKTFLVALDRKRCESEGLPSTCFNAWLDAMVQEYPLNVRQLQSLQVLTGAQLQSLSRRFGAPSKLLAPAPSANSWWFVIVVNPLVKLGLDTSRRSEDIMKRAILCSSWMWHALSTRHIGFRLVVLSKPCGVDPEVGRPRGFLHLQAHPVIDDPRHHMKPLHISFVPKAASRRLSHALTLWLETSGREIPGSLAFAWSTRAVCRWLQAVSATEPEILRQIIHVGDNVAFEEVVSRLMRVDMFRELCNAYEELLEFGLASEFPPLRFVGKKLNATTKLFDEQLGLSNCGELWVFLLVLLPKHLQMAIARELHETTSAMDIVKAVRCPWALPVEALRETLSILLQPPGSRQCDH